MYTVQAHYIHYTSILCILYTTQAYNAICYANYANTLGTVCTAYSIQTDSRPIQLILVLYSFIDKYSGPHYVNY